MSGPSFNQVTLVGRLTRDPELKTIGENAKVASFGLAVNGFKDHTDFFEVEAWNKTAEALVKYQHKGSLVLISGRMTHQTWEDKETKAKRSKVIVTAQSIKFLGQKPKDVPAAAGEEAVEEEVGF